MVQSDACGDASLPCRLLDALGKCPRQTIEPRIGIVVEQAQRGQPGCGREWVSRQRSRLVHVTGGRDPLHQLAPPGVRRGRQATADDLAEHGQVGRHALPLLRSAAADAEAA